MQLHFTGVDYREGVEIMIGGFDKHCIGGFNIRRVGAENLSDFCPNVCRVFSSRVIPRPLDGGGELFTCRLNQY